jgi:hypothetical protein
MGQYKTTHSHVPGPFGLDRAKRATIVDKETGNKASGEVWEHESFEKAEEKAWEKLQKQNEDEEDED